MWDIRPFAPLERCLKVFTGAQHNFEKVLNIINNNYNLINVNLLFDLFTDYKIKVPKIK